MQMSAEAAPTASDQVPLLHEIQSSLDKARRVLDQEPARPSHKKKKSVLQWLFLSQNIYKHGTQEPDDK